MKEKVISFFKKIYLRIKGVAIKCSLIFWDKISSSYMLCREGEENMKKLLFYWNFVPCITYFFVRYKFNNCVFFGHILDFSMFFVGILGIFFIQKALKKHPEYNTELVKELEKEEYYASLNEEELKEAKVKEKKENTKSFFRKVFLISSGDRIDTYKIVRLFTILTMLFVLKRILL